MDEFSQFSIEPFFLSHDNGAMFCVYIAPVNSKPHTSILYLHPFAEEMHKSRRMASLQARRFAEAGYSVLQIDLVGCGDSSGDFGDATFENWEACIHAGYYWLINKLSTPIYLWGLRLGATLAVSIVSQLQIAGLILWQPITNGEIYLNQFLRIRVASEMLASTQQHLGIKQLRNQLVSGESVEVGGYTLSPRLAADIDKISLTEINVNCNVCWLEITQNPNDAILPISLKILEKWGSRGINVKKTAVSGEPFWASQEIKENKYLLTKTVELTTQLIS